jgi:hypothetical protein
LGGAAVSVINGNKVFMFTKEPPPGDFVFIGVAQVSYGTGLNGDTGLDEVLSSNDNVRAVQAARWVGTGSKLMDES